MSLRLRQMERELVAPLISVVVNAFLAVTKVVAGMIGHSYALIADGIESVMDIFSSLIVWGGLKIGSLPADKNHPFGHGKAESLAALSVSLLLLAAAFGIAFQAVKEIQIHNRIPESFTIIVLMVVIIAKECLYRFLWKRGQRSESLSLQADAWHQRSDGLTSALAFVGISLALVFGKRFASADEWAALLACCVIAFNGLRFMRYSTDEIMDAAPNPQVEQKIRLLTCDLAGVHVVEKCRVRKSGVGYFVELHVEVNGNISVREGHEISHQVKDVLLRANLGIIDVVIHIEPSTF